MAGGKTSMGSVCVRVWVCAYARVRMPICTYTVFIGLDMYVYCMMRLEVEELWCLSTSGSTEREMHAKKFPPVQSDTQPPPPEHHPPHSTAVSSCTTLYAESLCLLSYTIIIIIYHIYYYYYYIIFLMSTNLLKYSHMYILFYQESGWMPDCLLVLINISTFLFKPNALLGDSIRSNSSGGLKNVHQNVWTHF